MDFRIADTFTNSLGKLTREEQKAAKQTAFDLQLNPANPGLKFHRLDGVKDKRFWSVRVNDDVRLIVHRSESNLLLCYVDHHDKAYQWAGRRKIERHPKTGAAQLVEVRETIREIEVQRYVEPKVEPVESRPLFADQTDEALLGFGVPQEWIGDVRSVDEDGLLALSDHLPKEAAEALLELATGGTPTPSTHDDEHADPFEHPDAQRRFRLMIDSEELERALEYPWDQWTIFLNPLQRDIVERDYSGPARVAGSAGTGKTIVALHRAYALARRHPDARVLVTTFSPTLAKHLRRKLKRLVGNDQSVGSRIQVRAIDDYGLELYEPEFGKARIPTPRMIQTIISDAMARMETGRFQMRFLESEWREVVDAWQLETWEAYRDVARPGRKTRLGEKQRVVLWQVFEAIRDQLAEGGLVTMPQVFTQLASTLADEPPVDFVVVDEAQDISVAQLRFLAAIAGNRANGLFFAGDLGQRIFQPPFSWRALGVDIRGRSRTLRMNYRTSHQIRGKADKLLPPELSDVDGNTESRKGTVSAFSGPDPSLELFDSLTEERACIGEWLNEKIAGGVEPHEIGVFVRSDAELHRAINAVNEAGFDTVTLDAYTESKHGCVSISSMHQAKGLEFRSVVVAGCDDEIMPSQARIEEASDESELERIYETERHLLYVACTRARDHLLLTGVKPGSEFLDDMG